MSKEKLKLSELKVQSFVTSLEETQMEQIKGGAIIKGRRYGMRSRWTSVDTRVEQEEGGHNNGSNNGG
jgi:hypothetical protein